MSLVSKIIGPDSKYDKSLPYTYEARMAIVEGEGLYNYYQADTICGLIEYLHENDITPAQAEIFEIYQESEYPIDSKLLTGDDHQWLFKPAICQSFRDHYKGHIQEGKCSFNDRDKQGRGP